MANALKIISLLVSYPTAELLKAGPQLHAAVDDEKTIETEEKASLDALIDDLCGHDIYDAEERYVLLFDRTRTLSLHLFEHVHGESRERGQAMVDLADMYKAKGFAISAKELPDYLPLFLEYLSTRPPEDVHDLLGRTVHIISALRVRLQKRHSIYANAFLVLETIADAQADAAALAEILKAPEDDPNDLQALDKIWEEEAVAFGADAQCNSCAQEPLAMETRTADCSARRQNV